jgi:hypothetical protein
VQIHVDFHVCLIAACSFLIIMNISQNHLNPPAAHRYSEQNKKGGKRNVGKSNSNIGF